MGIAMRRICWAAPAFVVSIFCASIGASWLLIGKFGSDIPFWDQWGAEGAFLLKPMLASGITEVNWFAAHNEHRIFLTRVTAAILFTMNGQWDAIVETCFNALLHASVGAALIVCVLKSQATRRTAALLGLIALAGSVLPFGWENTLAGFQNQSYYVALATIGMYWIASRRSPPTGVRIAALVALAIGAVFSLATGSISCMVGAAILGWRAFNSTPPQYRWRYIVAASLLFLIGAVGVMNTPIISNHAALQPGSVYEFVTALAKATAWPLHPFAAPLMWSPFLGLAFYEWKTRGQITSRSTLFVLAIGTFVFLNDIALAWSRGANGGVVTSRYTDLIWIGLFVNASAAFKLAERFTLRPAGVVLQNFGAAFVLISLIGLAYVSALQVDSIRERKRTYDLEVTNVLKYVQSGDFSVLSNQPFLAIPFPDAEFLRAQLDDPDIRAILPPSIRLGLLSEKGAIATSTFYNPGTYFQTPDPGPRRVFGSLGPSAGAGQSRLESTLLNPTSKLLSFSIAGNTSIPGEQFSLVPTDGSSPVNLMPATEPELSWTKVRVETPNGGFKLVAEDSSSEVRSWFAFTDPVEVGRLRGIADIWLVYAHVLLVVSLGVFLVSGVYLAANSAYERERY